MQIALCYVNICMKRKTKSPYSGEELYRTALFEIDIVVKPGLPIQVPLEIHPQEKKRDCFHKMFKEDNLFYWLQLLKIWDTIIQCICIPNFRSVNDVMNT